MLRTVTALTFVLLPAFAHAEHSEDEQRAACGMDVFRLCMFHIPDRAQISLCMIANRSQLSNSCRVVVDAGLAAKRRAR